ncbi:MAG: glycoside hydrolase family 25 protein [Clostridia bacterium]|nr:glycoside hydrolase family 25 protein [Clostridia bacterium]
MKNKAFSSDTNYKLKRTIFLGAVIVLVIAVLLLTVYHSIDMDDRTKPGKDNNAVVTTEDGKLVINDLYAGQMTIPNFDIALNEYETEKFLNNSGLVTYDDENASLGIDVSSYQEDIDWQQVKDSGIEFVMIRAGYRGATRGKLNEDANFQKNYEGAKAAGIKVGVYFFSQATSVVEAEEEAGYVLQLLQNKTLEYPVVFDWEVAEVTGSRTASVTGDQVTSYARAFCKKMDKGGFNAAVYFNRNLAYDYYDLEQLDDYDFWLAEYRTVPAFYYDFQIWQYSDNARVKGINTPVDINISFKDYK